MKLMSDSLKLSFVNLFCFGIAFVISYSQLGELISFLLIVTICPLMSLLTLFFAIRDVWKLKKALQAIAAFTISLIPIVYLLSGRIEV